MGRNAGALRFAGFHGRYALARTGVRESRSYRCEYGDGNLRAAMTFGTAADASAALATLPAGLAGMYEPRRIGFDEAMEATQRNWT